MPGWQPIINPRLVIVREIETNVKKYATSLRFHAASVVEAEH
jgi:hypothetical protein